MKCCYSCRKFLMELVVLVQSAGFPSATTSHIQHHGRQIIWDLYMWFSMLTTLMNKALSLFGRRAATVFIKAIGNIVVVSQKALQQKWTF